MDSSNTESPLLPQYGFGATYTFDALVEHHHFLYRVHTPKRRRVLSRPASPSPRSSSPLPSARRPELSRSPSLSASLVSVKSSESGPTDYFAFSPGHPPEDDDAPGDPYFLSRKFKEDLTSPDPGQRRRTISTLSSLSAGSGSFTYVGSDDGSDLESERSFGRRGTLSRSSSMMLGHSRVRSDSLSSSRPDARRSHSADVSESTTAAEIPDVAQSTMMTYSDLVRHLDWTTRSSSPYVTTSFSFFWCLWEAVRRYKLGVKHDVEIAVIDARKVRGRARTALEVLRSVEPDKQDKAYWKWYRFALESQDVLVFGAISGDAIYASIPLAQILPKLPSYCYVDDIPKQVMDPREPDLTIDPRSPTTQTQNPFLTSTPNKTRSQTNGEREREQERTALTTSYLLTKLAWDIGTTLRRPRKSKDASSLAPGKPAPRHNSHAEFCKALSASFARRSEADQLRDATTGAVSLAELLIEPWFRARCAELVTYPFRHDDDSDDEKEGSADKMHDSVCLGLAGDGCTLEHSHDSSIQDALFGADKDDETEEEAARREAASVLSELALSLARWPGTLWYTEHADTVEALVNDVVTMCVAEAARGLQGRIAWDIALEEERQRTRTISLSGSVRSRADSMSLSGSLHGSVRSERRGREEGRDRSRSRSWSPFSSPSKHVRIASEDSPSRQSSIHESPYKPRARSPLGASPVLGPAIVIRPKSRPESSQEQRTTQQSWSPSTPPPSPPLNHSRSEGDLRDTSPTRRSPPPPPPPRSPARSQSASAVSFESTLPSPNSSPSVSRTSSSLLKRSLHRRTESIPGGWPNGDSSPGDSSAEDRPGSPGPGQATEKKEEGDVFWDPSLRDPSKKRPLSWGGSGLALGGMVSSASSSSESLRATLQTSASSSPSNSIRRGSSRSQSDDQGREALLTEVVSSALGLGTGVIAGASEVVRSGSSLRLDTASSSSSSEAGSGTERPHVSARHRRHSSHGVSLEMELSPVREVEQEDEAEAEAGIQQRGAEIFEGRDTVETEATDAQPRIDVSEASVLTQTVLNDSPVEATDEPEISDSKVQETSDEMQSIPRQSSGTSTPRSERRRSSTLESIPEEDLAEWSLVEVPPESEYQAVVGRDEMIPESVMKEAEIPLPPSPHVEASELGEEEGDDAIPEVEPVQRIPEITLSVDESDDAGRREEASRVVAEESADNDHLSPSSGTTEASRSGSTKALPDSKMFIFPFNLTLREPLARTKALLSSFFVFPLSRLFSSLRTMTVPLLAPPPSPMPSPIFEDSELPIYSRRSWFFSIFRVPFVHPDSGFFGRWRQESQPLSPSTLSILTPPPRWDAPILDLEDEPHASVESSVGYWDSRSTSWAVSCFVCGVAAALYLAAVQEHRCEAHMWIGNRYY